MQVNGLDHINIVTHDLDGTARYYKDVIGLDPRDPPGGGTPRMGWWIYDANNRPIIHLVSSAAEMPFAGRARPGDATGAIDHVALNCSGYDAMASRMESHGAEFRRNEVKDAGLRQLFTIDPNGVLLELNFFGD